MTENELAAHLPERIRVSNSCISGVGLEMRALNSPLPVPSWSTVRNVDRYPVSELSKLYPDLAGQELAPVHIIDDGETLATIPDTTEDFIIANHFLEYTENPIGTLRNMLRVMKPGASLYLSVYDKRFSDDVDRPVTSLEHLLLDDRLGPEWSRRKHVEEWCRLVLPETDEASFRKKVRECMRTDCRVRYHVWTQMEVLELVSHAQKRWPFSVETMVRNLTEVIFVLRSPG